MPFPELLYRAALGALRAVSPLASRGGSKLARGIRGRRGSAAALVRWAREERRPDRPLLWVHAPSVGEGLQARAVLEAVRRLEPEVQAVFTHFSPSAEPLAARMPVEVAGYLPWDLAGVVGPALEALRPDALVFTKTEVWPVLVGEAWRRGIASVLTAATLPEGSSRLSPLARPLLRPAYARLDAVHAIAPDDGERFARLGVSPSRVTVTGDPGVDSAAARLAAVDAAGPHLRPFREPAPRVVAGSTWPADEAVLLPALERLRGEVPGLQIVLVPHEPRAERVRDLLARLGARGWSAATLAEVEVGGPEANAIVVERVGVLADLYTVAGAAFVGGGFHDKGLHSVLEPAAAGVPVCFGPRHANARAAEELLAAGSAAVAGDAAGLAGTLGHWLRDGGARARAGAAGLRYIAAHRGAAERSARSILALAGRGG